ncbi:MAG TPA: antibiotic biosynthesis monooxygenase [Acidimicrobiia bacterium]|nr:antibiotic biosynthesis monooxygenase [Acidimicrobiia bacterium]
MKHRSPTIIVSRRVRPGREREFERWNARIRAVAESFPGHLGSEAQPPDDAHPDEWMIVYRFATPEQLETWMSSPERRALLEEGNRLLDGPVREQRLVQPEPGPGAVTAVMSQRVRPEAWQEFRRAHAEISAVMRGFDGFLSSELAEPVGTVQTDHVVVFAFDSRQNLDRWLASPERREILDMIEPLIEGERVLNVVGGFAGWFQIDDTRPPLRWKQAVTVLIALYPTTLGLGFVQRAVAPEAPWVLSLFVSNVVGIAILTWLLMPVVTRLLGRWLQR